MEILQIITRGDSIGGAQIHVLNLAKGLKDKGHKVTVATGTVGVFSELLQKNNIDTIPIQSLSRSIHFGRDKKAYQEIQELILEKKPDIVACHSSKAGVLVRLVTHKLSIPSVYTIHGWSFADGIPYIKQKVFLQIERYMKNKTQHLISVCEEDRQLGIKKRVIEPKDITTIYNGAEDLSVSYPKKPDSTFTIAMVARFQEQKDHMSLLRALSSLKELEWKVRFIGDGEETLDEVKDYIQNEGIEDRIEFVGYTSEVGKYLSDVSLFALISKWEGFPISVLEAMSLGIPVIASDVGGVREQVFEGKNGFLIPRGDVITLSHQLRKLIEDKHLLESMGMSSKQIYADNFSLEQNTSKTEDLYHKIIASKK